MQPPDKWQTPKSGKKPKPKREKISLSEFPNLGLKSVSTPGSSSKAKPLAKEVLLKDPVYLKKSTTEHVVDITVKDSQLQMNPWSFKERYLGNQNSALPDGKFRYIYEAILTETGSVQITHNLYKASVKTSPITHSKCHVVKVLQPEEWGFDLSKSKPLKLKEGIGYNYWDYIQAWTTSFYYQNPIRKHSWLISLNPKISQAGYPTWFLRWWDKFGPYQDILPAELQTLYQQWCTCNPKIKGMSIHQNFLEYFAEFQVTWIWKWELELFQDHLNIPILQRTFYYRWWEGFESDKAAERMAKAISHYNTSKKEGVSGSSSWTFSTEDLFKFFCEQVQERNPSWNIEQCRIDVLSRMKEQYVMTTTEMGMGKRVENQLIPMITDIAGESQAPEEDIQSSTGSTSTLPGIDAEEIDVMIDIETAKLRAKSKGKKSK